MAGNMLRGVQSGVVLHRGASLLSSAAGSAATFKLSTPTDHLEAFISHNWSVGRSRKWLALVSLHYNFSVALVCGIPGCRCAVRGQLRGLVAAPCRRRPERETPGHVLFLLWFSGVPRRPLVQL